jgi:hypothetical protein
MMHGFADNQVMTLRRPPEDVEFRPQVAARLREAIKDKGRGVPARLATACDVTPQAVSQWQRNGRIDRGHWRIISAILEVREEWLFLGTGPKRDDGASEEPSTPYKKPSATQEDEFAQATPGQREIALNVIRALRGQVPENDGGSTPRKSGGPRRRR